MLQTSLSYLVRLAFRKFQKSCYTRCKSVRAVAFVLKKDAYYCDSVLLYGLIHRTLVFSIGHCPKRLTGFHLISPESEIPIRLDYWCLSQSHPYY